MYIYSHPAMIISFPEKVQASSSLFKDLRIYIKFHCSLIKEHHMLNLKLPQKPEVCIFTLNNRMRSSLYLNKRHYGTLNAIQETWWDNLRYLSLCSFWILFDRGLLAYLHQTVNSIVNMVLICFHTGIKPIRGDRRNSCTWHRANGVIKPSSSSIQIESPWRKTWLLLRQTNFSSLNARGELTKQMDHLTRIIRGSYNKRDRGL